MGGIKKMTYTSCSDLTGDRKLDCIINQLTRPADYIMGRVAIVTTNTPVQIKTTSTEISTIKLQALPTNSRYISVGYGDTVSAVTGGEIGIILTPGESKDFEIDDLNKMYINGTSGDAVTYIAY